MNFALAEMPLPLRFRPEKPMSDEDLMRFCAANDFLRVERNANGGKESNAKLLELEVGGGSGAICCQTLHSIWIESDLVEPVRGSN
jgi:hypothetical protein